MDVVMGRKQRCCCRLLPKDDTLRCLTYMVILLNIYWLAIWLLFYLKLILGASVNYDFLKKSEPYTALNDREVAINYAVVFFPV